MRRIRSIHSVTVAFGLLVAPSPKAAAWAQAFPMKAFGDGHIPSDLTIDGKPVHLTAIASRDRMPSPERRARCKDGGPLMVTVLAVPHDSTSAWLPRVVWLVRAGEVGSFAEFRTTRTSDAAGTRLTAYGGPCWPTGIKIDLVVEWYSKGAAAQYQIIKGAIVQEVSWRRTVSPPDSIPAWLNADSSIAGRIGTIGAFTKRIVLVAFKPTATASDRQAAIRAVGGTVVGGVPVDGGEGYYYVQIPDRGAGVQLRAAIRTLMALPQVDEVSLDYRDTEPAH